MTAHQRMRPWQLLVLVMVMTISKGMAVDRSKFRTCEQTSFCRRHRGQHSARLYDYKLLSESVQFHLPKEESAAAAAAAAVVQEEKKGLWQSLQTRVLGASSSSLSSSSSSTFATQTPTLTGILLNTASETSTGDEERLQWSVHAMKDGVLRMRITEVQNHHNKREPRVTYDDLVLEQPTFLPATHVEWIRPQNDPTDLLSKVIPQTDNVNNYMALQYGDQPDGNMVLVIRLEPFAVYLHRDLASAPILTLGNEEMMHFEIRRSPGDESKSTEDKDDDNKPETVESDLEHPEKEVVGYWEDGLAIYADGSREERAQVVEEEHRQLTESELDREGLWEEHFQSHKDTKPNGPMSIGMDISFPQSQHLFGLPEHASSTKLQSTFGSGAHYSEPYRLYNLDVFEYEVDEPMALYGHVPMIVSQSQTSGTAGVFWFNPSETFVDVLASEPKSNGKTTTHWMSESGIVDVFLIPGPTPRDLYRQYAQLTGTTPLPPMFSLGYHQCRWNYKDEADVYMVHNKFEELDYPYDVLWLDIEHTDGKRYFTWDDNLFPHPVDMQDKLASQGRRMVTIVDPHIKRDDQYYIHKEATAKGYYVKDKDGKKDYDGWCWPGSSSYLDFTNSQVRSWWADQFGYNRYKGSTSSLFTWNDMNEPSVFNGPEVTMQKDLKNLNGDEHREWHNLYGMLFHRATGEGQIRRNQPDEDIRPFVLTRSFFAGSQRYGAIWTGDNSADWSHLAITAPMLLSLNVAALSFVGADVGGFFGNTDAELMTRWMQAGAYQPFFRGHAHHDAKRREPWMFGDETMRRLRKSAMARYALLPYWYTVFREAEVTGMPVMRIMWMEYPETEALFGTDDQYLIGSDLLVKPITGPGVTRTSVLFPKTDAWYDVDTMQVVSEQGTNTGVAHLSVASDIDKIPVYQRGGSIISRKLRLRRSARLMKSDPYTLYIALDKDKRASGSLYMDDEETVNHVRQGEYAEAMFTVDLSTGVLRNVVTVGSGWALLVDDLKADRMIERIVIMGVTDLPKAITVSGSPIDFQHDATSKLLVLRKPDISAMNDWQVEIIQN